jgi:hypothetical protein
MERFFLYICNFKFFFFQHHIHKKIFNTFSTNMHLNSFQLNLNPIVELHLVLIQFKVHAMEMKYVIDGYYNKVLHQSTS